jgi:HD-GYP domain-containing protein (c-di-GMP phosphodiesterase class II)
VATLAGLIATELGLTADAVMRCRLGGWLHDLGKVAIPDRVLVKPGLLDEEEWEVMRTHSEIGERIVNRIAGLAQAAPIVRHHHERMDGTGYPDGLQGDEIPIEARIVAVADAYSALTTDRAYRYARSSEDAIAVLQATSGAHHDPRCVEALVAVLAERAAYRRRSLVR